MRQGIPPEVFEDKVKRLCDLAAPYASASREEIHELWLPIKRFVQELAAEGWTRGDIHDLAWEAEEREAGYGCGWEPIGDLLTALTGDCAQACILRLPGEPEGREEFLTYVYGKSWLNSSPTRS